MGGAGVSVIVAAYNAEATLGETLESLLAQTHRTWEAIVVDDGSTDRTAEIAAGFSEADGRVRLASQSHGGDGKARNTGIGLAGFDWLLFLDADDWLHPTALERLTELVAADGSLGAAYGAWARVGPDGGLTGRHYWNRSDQPFAVFARTCVLAIHSCLVRRSLVHEVGGFDSSLQNCRDWDLWQRIARTGARFRGVDELLALYRMRADSVSADGFDLIASGLRVIERGHMADPRVTDPDPAYAEGAPADELAEAKLHFACWAAGLVIGRAEDPGALLRAVANEHEPELSGLEIAHHLLEAVPVGALRGPAAWAQLWPDVEPRLDPFLSALELQAGAPGLARRARRALERLAIERADAARPLTFGATHAVKIEVTAAIPDLTPPPGAERLDCWVELEGTGLGRVTLPVCDGCVPSTVLADAICAPFYWTILRRFFERTLYEGHEDHDRVGWAVFLRELWGRPDWPVESFYDRGSADGSASLARPVHDRLVLEAARELPDVECPGQSFDVLETGREVATGCLALSRPPGRWPAGQLRAALTAATGAELCRAAVREGLVGTRLEEGGPLRERLASAATRRAETPPLGAGATGRAGDELVLGRRAAAPIDTSISRRAALPAAAAAALSDAAAAAGEPVLELPRPGAEPRRAAYAPDLFLRSCGDAADGWEAETEPEADGRPPTRSFPFDRHYFEGAFAARSDPWHYTNAYEQRKYEETLSLIPESRFERSLEIGCAEGRFTQLLAPRVGGLVAVDISEVALGRAAARCADFEHVSFRQLDLLADPLPGRYELIVCSELLYYLGDRGGLEEAARKIAAAMEPDGWFVTANSNLLADEPDRPGFNWDLPFGSKTIGDTFAALGGMRLKQELYAPPYRIQLFRAVGPGRRRLPLPRPRPRVVELPPPPPLPPHVSEDFASRGRPVRVGASAAVVTHRLPILMYHRLATTGAPSTARYRVSPEAFEQQLRYLRSAGFYGVGLDEWRRAMELRRPLPGRAVMITFDDGYRDFRTHGWPLLERYGFTALVFLTADEVGRSNSWNAMYGEDVPLLGWEEIRRLSRAGAQFGSHSCTHARLTGLDVADVAREAARSRALLQRGLGRPVTAFAYPNGDVDPAVQHLVGGCGFIYGLTCRNEHSRFEDQLLDLPRIEVEGTDSLEDFIGKLGA